MRVHEWEPPQTEQVKKLIVRVKRSDKLIDANSVLSFVAKIKYLQNEEEINKLVFVANNGFTQKAFAEAQQLDIDLFTLNELETALQNKNSFITDLQQQEQKASKAPTVIVPAIPLRCEPRTVSRGEFREVFELDDEWRPREYIENDFEGFGEVVVDHVTSLMWQKSGSDWLRDREAQGYVDRLNRERFTGSDDWRLPTIPELISLLELEKQSNDLYINPIFAQKQRWCWSVDRQPEGESSAGAVWVVNFRYGRVNSYFVKDFGYMRCVRSLATKEGIIKNRAQLMALINEFSSVSPEMRKMVESVCLLDKATSKDRPAWVESFDMVNCVSISKLKEKIAAISFEYRASTFSDDDVYFMTQSPFNDKWYVFASGMGFGWPSKPAYIFENRPEWFDDDF